MDVQEYISSGILESYVLGFCSSDEIAEVERLMDAHEAIRNEIESIQATMELTAQLGSKAPMPALKSKIWEAIQEESASALDNSLLEEKVDAPIHRLKPATNWLRYAASFTLLFSVSSLAIYFFTEKQQTESQLLAANKQLEQLKATSSEKDAVLLSVEAKLALIAAPSTVKVALAGVPSSKDSKATVFWNPTRKEVILTGIDLPSHPNDKQYQLWALVDGVPVDAGVFDANSDEALISMKSIGESQAFAITLEPKGGSPSPHLEALCVIGNVL